VAKVIGIEPRDDLLTRYSYAFRQRYVYKNPTLEGQSAEHELIPFFDSEATPQPIHEAAKDNGVRLITGSGHGTEERFLGHGGIPIFEVPGLSTEYLDGKIIHLLACHVGAHLGVRLVTNGATAFWGYTGAFLFCHYSIPPEQLAADDYAEWFFAMDSLIDKGILEGRNSTQIYAELVSWFNEVYSLINYLDLNIDDVVKMRAALHHDFVHIASPALNWGNPEVVI